MKILPSGKGWFLWILSRVEGGDPLKVAARAKAQGVSWVGVKVNDGAGNFNTRPVKNTYGSVISFADDLLQPLVDALHDQGIQVFGWGYIYLSSPAREAQKSIDRVKKFGLDGYIVDAEVQWDHKPNEAAAYMNALRAGLPDTSIGLCSFRFPTLHPEFPWLEALGHADYHCPQVYWANAHNSADQLSRSAQELTARKPLPIIPLGYAYQNETDATRPTQAEINAFHAKAQSMGLPGEGWYEWGDSIRAGVESFVGALRWGDVVIPPPLPVPEYAPAIPGPFLLLSDGDITGNPQTAFESRFPGAPLDAYPASIVEQGGNGVVNLSTAWQSALRAIMTIEQWARTWVANEGWHNSGAIGAVKEVLFAHNVVWVKNKNYEIDCYYNSDSPPDLRAYKDPYRVHIMSIMYRFLNGNKGGIGLSDLLLPVLVIARDRSEALRVDPKYLRSLKSLPFKAHVKTDGTHLNVRDAPSTGAVQTTLNNGVEVTVFDMVKLGNRRWGRITEPGSGIPGWIALDYTDAGV